MATHTTVPNRPAARRGLTRPPLWTLGIALLLLILVGTLWFNIARPVIVLPRITLAPGYLLESATGDTLTSGDRLGHMTLYSFTHATCMQADCPQSAADIAQVRAGLAAWLPADSTLDIVTISLDPTHDTPAVLAALAAEHAAPGRIGWHWLTGDAERVRYVVGGGFELYYRAGADGVQFTPRYVLVDEFGMIRARYFDAIPDPAIVERDVRFLISEHQNSRGAGRLAYEAAHLFACYPR